MAIPGGFTVCRWDLDSDWPWRDRHDGALGALARACRPLADRRFASRRSVSRPRRRMAGACRSLLIPCPVLAAAPCRRRKACRSLLISAKARWRRRERANIRPVRREVFGCGAAFACFYQRKCKRRSNRILSGGTPSVCSHDIKRDALESAAQHAGKVTSSNKRGGAILSLSPTTIEAQGRRI